MTRPNPHADPGKPCLCGLGVLDGCPEHDAADCDGPADWTPPGDCDDRDDPWPVEWGGIVGDCGRET